MLNIFKRNRETTKSYRVTYIDGDEIFTENVNSNSYSNFIMSLDCAGCEIVEIKEV